MIDRIFQIVMLTFTTLCMGVTSALLLMFVKVLGLLPSLGSPENDMLYLFVGGLIGLIAGIVCSIWIARRDPYHVPHFLLAMFALTILSVVVIGSLGRSFNLAI